jgi:sulfite reductase alpha subunit-like flavoprotein
MEVNHKRVCILFGSQTGTAEEISYRLSDHTKAKGFATKVMSLELYDLVNIWNNTKLISEFTFGGYPACICCCYNWTR